jgi:hypothetical protein
MDSVDNAAGLAGLTQSIVNVAAFAIATTTAGAAKEVRRIATEGIVGLRRPGISEERRFTELATVCWIDRAFVVQYVLDLALAKFADTTLGATIAFRTADAAAANLQSSWTAEGVVIERSPGLVIGCWIAEFTLISRVDPTGEDLLGTNSADAWPAGCTGKAALSLRTAIAQAATLVSAWATGRVG